MASTDKTKNEGLPIWAAKDTPKVGDFNDANEKIDAALSQRAKLSGAIFSGSIESSQFTSKTSSGQAASVTMACYSDSNPYTRFICTNANGESITIFFNPNNAGIYPSTNGTGGLGLSGNRFSTGYFASDIIVSSDANEKHEIRSLDLDVISKLFMSLRPVSFKYNDGTSDRSHYGLISQEVEEAMNEAGLLDRDFGGLIKSPKVDQDGNEIGGETYGLRYGEFHAPTILMVQQQQRRIEKLEHQVAMLMEAMNEN